MRHDPKTSSKGLALAERLEEAAEELIAVVQHIDLERWARIPESGVWSPGKDAEHVADAAVHHQWIVRLTIRHRVPARPVLERKVLTAERSQEAVVDLLRHRDAIQRKLGQKSVGTPPSDLRRSTNANSSSRRASSSDGGS
jgi:hypothetical protein